jgi:hypothetical protein
MLDGAAAMVAETLREYLARPVVYRRGPLSVSLAATVGQSEMDVLDEAGAVVRIATRDYLVTAADLVLGGAAVEPRRGDRIEDERDGLFEVLSPGAGEPDWRWMAGRRMYRIHVKEIE